MKFNNKETYLAYRSNWKSEYKLLSQQIRIQKLHVRSQHTPSWRDYLSLKELKEKATAMLLELKESKQEAQRQYLAAKESELVLA